MILIPQLVAIFLFVCSTLAIALNLPQALNSPNLGLVLPLPYSRAPNVHVPLQSQSSSALQPKATPNIPPTSNNVISDCDDDMYGQPSVESCEDAFKQMSDDHAWLEFGDRTRGRYDVPLPYRYTSGTDALESIHL